MKVLITGGTGFIGSRLALRCLQRGQSVRVLGQERNAAEAENKAYQFFGGAVEVDGRVYVGAASGYVYVLDAATGNLIWKHQVSDWVRSKPLVLGDDVYVATWDGILYRLQDNGATVTEVWQRQVAEHGFTADLTGNANGILLGGRDYVLYSISPETGYLQWHHSMLDGTWVDGVQHTADIDGGNFQSSPVVVDGVLYIGGPDGILNAIDVDTGQEVWKFEAGGKISAAPLVAEGKVFFGYTSSNLEYFALDKDTGELVWQKNFTWVFQGAAYNDGTVFFGDIEGNFRAVNPDNGNVLWTFSTTAGFFPNPAVDSSKVYSGAHDGKYYAFDQATGNVVWSTMTGTGSGGDPDSAAVVLWENHAYVQKQGNQIAALNLSNGNIDWTWTAPGGFLQNGTVAAFDDKIFGSTVRQVKSLPYNATIYAFNDVAAGGGQLWSYRGGGGLTGPVGTDSSVIFGSSGDPFVTAVDPDTGALLWRFYTGGAMEEAIPAIYGDKVFTIHRNGYLYAID